MSLPLRIRLDVYHTSDILMSDRCLPSYPFLLSYWFFLLFHSLLLPVQNTISQSGIFVGNEILSECNIIVLQTSLDILPLRL